MTYLEFHQQWHQFGCFNIHQLYAWRRNFNRQNLRNWMKKGYIVPLRKEWYAFADCRKIPDFSRYIANRIYRPSYISLHTALSFYGIIPEAVFQFTSVTALKTIRFSNYFGEYAYHSVKNEMMFGFVPLPMLDGLRATLIAKPEKAIIDLLYLCRSGFNAQLKDRQNTNLTAFRRNIYFPQLLFNLSLTGHREERFLLKMEVQDQRIEYEPVMVNVSG